MPTSSHAERMIKNQTPRIPIHRNPPFLHDLANFGSARTPDQLNQSQAGQIIRLPAPKRSPAVIQLGEVIGAQYVDEIDKSGQLVFHSAGDTGFGGTWDVQLVEEVMTM